MKRLWQSLTLVYRCDRRAFVRRVVYVLLQSLLPLASLVILKHLIDSVTASVGTSLAETAFWPYLLALTAVFLVGRTVRALDNVNTDILTQRLTDYMCDIMQHQAARLDMAYYDTPEYHDTYHRAQQESAVRPLRILDDAMAIVGSAVSIGGVTVMLVAASWWVVAVMVVAVVPSFTVRMLKARRIYDFRRSNTQLYRRTVYYNQVLTSRATAHEMRLYRLAPHFRALFVEVRARLVSRLLRISRRLGAADVACAVVEAAAMMVVVALLAMRTYGGALSIGAFVMLFEAFRRGQSYLTALASGIAGLYDNRLFVSNLFEFLDMQPTVTDPDEPLPLPEHIECLELRDVTFRYPGMQHDVLSHYDFVARVGEITSLHGENGLGKSTVLKLLARLYDPQQGTVLLNGIDVRRFRLAELRQRMGVIFQDFVRYQCTFGENIAFGDIDHPDADTGAAATLAGADGIAAGLPNGVDTQLGRMFDQGQELSMGQWQRVALARALQNQAQVLLLDEPAAWLDVAARRHLQQTLESLKTDRIIILVTHSDIDSENLAEPQ